MILSGLNIILEMYYINHNNKTTYDDPRRLQKASLTSSQPTLVSAKLPAKTVQTSTTEKETPLPDGWEIRTDSSGRSFENASILLILRRTIFR